MRTLRFGKQRITFANSRSTIIGAARALAVEQYNFGRSG